MVETYLAAVIGDILIDDLELIGLITVLNSAMASSRDAHRLMTGYTVHKLLNSLFKRLKIFRVKLTIIVDVVVETIFDDWADRHFYPGK